MFPTRNLTVSILRPWQEVYAFTSKPEGFRQWAAGLGQSLRQEGGRWVVDTPKGRAEVRFTPPNAFGVIDHHVRFADGHEIYIPIRIIPNGDGAEVVLTLFRLPDMTVADFERDAGLVAKDLQTLKALLEA